MYAVLVHFIPNVKRNNEEQEKVEERPDEKNVFLFTGTRLLLKVVNEALFPEEATDTLCSKNYFNEIRKMNTRMLIAVMLLSIRCRHAQFSFMTLL